jgi:hypothetical protein
MSETLELAENAARKVLLADLGRHAELAHQAFRLADKTVGRIAGKSLDEVPQAQKVVVALVIILANDLRAASILALSGYSTQSADIVAGMYEAAYTVAYVGADETRAQQWIEHDDPTRSFLPAKNLTEAVVGELNVSDPVQVAKLQYRNYRQLCMAKHSNPLLMKQTTYKLEENTVVAEVGPNTSEPSIRSACFALEHAIGLATFAMERFIQDHLRGASVDDLLREVAELERGREEIKEAAIARWGTEDPDPGKWKM